MHVFIFLVTFWKPSLRQWGHWLSCSVLVRSSDYLSWQKQFQVPDRQCNRSSVKQYVCSRGNPPTESPSEKCIVCSSSSATLLDHYYCATLPTNHGNGWKQEDGGNRWDAVGSAVFHLCLNNWPNLWNHIPLVKLLWQTIALFIAFKVPGRSWW